MEDIFIFLWGIFPFETFIMLDNKNNNKICTAIIIKSMRNRYADMVSCVADGDAGRADEGKKG